MQNALESALRPIGNHKCGVEYLSPDNGRMISLVYDMNRHDERVKITKLIIWAMLNLVELRINPVA